MASSLTIRLGGVTGILNKLKLLVPRIKQAAGDTVAETLLLIESDAKGFVPVDTGLLRSSIHSEQAANRLSGRVATNVSYAPHVEFGTKYQRAQPFMFPAYEKNRQAFVANLKANLKLF